jgi:hypothetical protein
MPPVSLTDSKGGHLTPLSKGQSGGLVTTSSVKAGQGRPKTIYKVVSPGAVRSAATPRLGARGVSRESLVQMQEVHAFDPAPRRSELHDLYVPFDEMTGAHGCEQSLGDALRRRNRVALVGISGSASRALPRACSDHWSKGWPRCRSQWPLRSRRSPRTACPLLRQQGETGRPSPGESDDRAGTGLVGYQVWIRVADSHRVYAYPLPETP